MYERNNSAFLNEGEEMGMTDSQYKGMLLDQLRDWKQVLALAVKAESIEIQQKAEEMIEAINEKLKF